MGIDVAFFAAPDDRAAVEVGGRPGGPLGWPVMTGHRKTGWLRREPVITELGPLLPGVATRGYDPVVTLGTLEELLTGRPYESVMEDPRAGGSPALGDADAPDDHGVVTITDALRDALAAADDARLAEVVGPWSQTEELQQTGWEDVFEAEHLTFLRSLRDLSATAADAGHRLYAYYALDVRWPTRPADLAD